MCTGRLILVPANFLQQQTFGNYIVNAIVIKMDPLKGLGGLIRYPISVCMAPVPWPWILSAGGGGRTLL